MGGGEARPGGGVQPRNPRPGVIEYSTTKVPCRSADSHVCRKSTEILWRKARHDKSPRRLRAATLRLCSARSRSVVWDALIRFSTIDGLGRNRRYVAIDTVESPKGRWIISFGTNEIETGSAYSFKTHVGSISRDYLAQWCARKSALESIVRNIDRLK